MDIKYTDSDIHFETLHGTNNFPFIVVPHGDLTVNRNIYVNCHNNFEIVYVKTGVLRLYINDTLVELNQDEAAIINSGNIHFGFTVKPALNDYYALVFDGDIFCLKNDLSSPAGIFNDIIYNKLLFPRMVITSESPPGVLLSIKNAINAFMEHQQGWELSVIAEYYNMVSIFFRQGLLEKNTDIGLYVRDNQKNDIDVYIRFMKYVERYYSRELIVPEIAHELDISDSKLYKLCKSISGYSPIEYILRYRLERSARKLVYSRDKITDICYDSGFKNVSYYITCFKSLFGITPKKFRQRNTE